jgi:hypothetical protein
MPNSAAHTLLAAARTAASVRNPNPSSHLQLLGRHARNLHGKHDAAHPAQMAALHARGSDPLLCLGKTRVHGETRTKNCGSPVK